MNTNASKLNIELFKTIISSLNHIIFSIYSQIPKGYEAIRKGGEFENVIKNLKEFCENYADDACLIPAEERWDTYKNKVLPDIV